MSVIEEKLNRFERIIFSEVDAKINATIEEADAHKAAVLSDHHEKLLGEYFDAMQQQVKQIQAETKQQISQAELDVQRELLLRRSEIADRVFASVRQRLTDFTKNEDYRPYLLQKLDAALQKAGLTQYQVLVREADRSLLEGSAYAAALTTDDSIRLGGFILMEPAGSYMIDESFDSKLEELTAYFNRTSGLTIDRQSDLQR